MHWCFIYRDVFILHDRITDIERDTELPMSLDESEQIHQAGLEEKDFVLTYVLTHYSTRRQLADQYTFGMGTLDEMEQDVHLPNFHDMVLSTDYESDVIDESNEPCQDRSTIPVLRCFLSGPGYKTMMIFKFAGFYAEWGGEGWCYYASNDRDDRNKTISPELDIYGGAEADYRQDDLSFCIEARTDLLSIFTQLFRGQDPSSGV